VPVQDGSEPTAVEYWALMAEALEGLAAVVAGSESGTAGAQVWIHDDLPWL
jgi:hypothetical protein